MKYLTDYTQEAQTKLFEEKGVFFAFSNKQFEEQRKAGIKYKVTNWMFSPKGKLQNVLSNLDNIQEEGM